MKDSGNFIGKPDLNKHEMWEVFIQTEEPDSNRADTDIFVKILDSTYSKAELNKFATAAFHIDKY